MITANRRASATIAFFIPRCLAIFIAQALSQDHFVERTSMIWHRTWCRQIDCGDGDNPFFMNEPGFRRERWGGGHWWARLVGRIRAKTGLMRRIISLLTAPDLVIIRRGGGLKK